MVAGVRAVDRALVALADLEGLMALHDRRSGQTHLLVEPQPAILAALWEAGDAPIGIAALHDALASRFALPGGAEEQRALIAERLAELQAIGLVAIAPPAPA